MKFKLKILAQACRGSGHVDVIPNRACWVYTRGTLRAIGSGPASAGTQMKLARNVLIFMLPLILWPCVARPQENSLARDPVFRSARKAQQEGRIADAEKILNDRIHASEQTQPNSPELIPYLNLLASIEFMKQQTSDGHAIYERVLEIDRSAFGPSDSRSVRDLINAASTLGPGKNEGRTAS